MHSESCEKIIESFKSEIKEWDKRPYYVLTGVSSHHHQVKGIITREKELFYKK